MFSVGLCLQDISTGEDLRKEMEWYNRLSKEPLFLLSIFRNESRLASVTGASRTDLMFFEISDREDLEILKQIRKKHTEVVIIYDGNVSPEEIVVPEIRPLSLHRRPLGEGQIREMVQRSWFHLMKREDSLFFNRRFICHDRTRNLMIPYAAVYYFETRNKRIVVVTSRGEYEFYDSFSRMVPDLPEEFVRCHRSYIVNLIYLTSVDLAHLQIELNHKIRIPVSRKYRGQVEKVSAEGRRKI